MSKQRGLARAKPPTRGESCSKAPKSKSGKHLHAIQGDY